jgi:hypothetical protein
MGPCEAPPNNKLRDTRRLRSDDEFREGLNPSDLLGAPDLPLHSGHIYLALKIGHALSGPIRPNWLERAHCSRIAFTE